MNEQLQAALAVDAFPHGELPVAEIQNSAVHNGESIVTTKEHIWMDASKSLPMAQELVLMEHLIPLPDCPDIRKICYSVGFYVDENGYEPIDDELLDVSTYQSCEGGAMRLASGWYFVFEDWRGKHVHDVGIVNRWMSFTRHR